MVVLTPTTSGPITGGTTVRLIDATVLNMSASTPDFTDGVLDGGFWTLTSTGTGAVFEVSGQLSLNTGATANSIAGARTQVAENDIDVEVRGQRVINDAPVGGSVTLFELRLYVDASNQFRLVAARTRGVSAVQGIVTVGGVTTFNQPVSTFDASATLRLLRAGSRVLAFVGGVQVMDATWSSTAAHIEVRAENDATFPGQVASRIAAYLRRPVVTFGGEPLSAVTNRSTQQIEGGVPARLRPGVVDVAVTGAAGATDSISGGFTYVLDAGVVVYRQSGQQLTTVRDRIVRGQV